jgi:adenylate cyclase
VRRAGDQVRINAQLIDATTGGHLWAERYDGSITDVFALQDKVTAKIVSALAVNLTATEKTQVARMPTQNLEAYDYYLRANRGFWVWSSQGRRDALLLYQKAITLDPTFADGYAGIADAAAAVWRWDEDDVLPGAVARKRAYEAASRALALDPHNARAYSVLGLLQMTDSRHDEAIASAQKSISLDPNNAGAYTYLATVLTYAGRHTEALAAMETALRLNPKPPPVFYGDLGSVLFHDRQYEKAIEPLEKALEAGVEDFATLAMTYAQLGRLDEARTMVDKILEHFRPANLAYFRTFWAYHKRKEDLEHSIDSLRKAGMPEWPFGYEGRPANRLDERAIAALIFGRTWNGQDPDGAPFFQEISKDGKVAFRSPVSLLTGTAWVEGGMLCYQFSAVTLSRKSCGYLFRNPSGTHDEQNEYVQVGLLDILYFSVKP